MADHFLAIRVFERREVPRPDGLTWIAPANSLTHVLGLTESATSGNPVRLKSLEAACRFENSASFMRFFCRKAQVERQIYLFGEP